MTDAGDRHVEPGPATITVSTHREGDTLIIRLRGVLAADTVPGLDLLAPALTTATRHVIVDTSGVDFVDGAGLRALLQARHACAGHGIGFVLHRPSAHLQWLMDLTCTTELLLVPGPAGAAPDERRSDGHAERRPPSRTADRRHAADQREQILDDRERAVDDREGAVDDRELLADEREKLLDEREHRVSAHQEWEDIREDLANQRDQDLQRREDRSAQERRDQDC